ncbi:mCG21580 [Mus musculus]|nr:mCG21580 [Mus musculus]
MKFLVFLVLICASTILVFCFPSGRKSVDESNYVAEEQLIRTVKGKGSSQEPEDSQESSMNSGGNVFDRAEMVLRGIIDCYNLISRRRGLNL